MSEEQILANQPDVEPAHEEQPQEKGEQNVSNEEPETPKVETSKCRMFLIEFILEDLQLSYCTEFMHRCYRGPDCVSLKFLAQPPLVICHNMAILKDSSETKTGASLLFTMTTEEVLQARKAFIVHIEAYRSIPDENIPLGNGQVDLTNIMKCICAKYDSEDIRQEIEKEEIKHQPHYVRKPPVDIFTDTLHDMPVLQTLPDSICETAATVDLNIRLTCFGKLVQTKCQLVPTSMTLNDK